MLRLRKMQVFMGVNSYIYNEKHNNHHKIIANHYDFEK